MVGRIVAQVECAEARAESSDAEVQLVGDAVVDVPHRHLEAVTAVTDLDVGREVVGDVDRHLERELGDETVDGDGLRRGVRLANEKLVVELRRAGEIALEPERRARGEDGEQRRDREEQGEQWRSFHCAAPPSWGGGGGTDSGDDDAVRARTAKE